MANSGDLPRWVLGLDIGSNSVGWAALRLDEHGDLAGMLSPTSSAADRPAIGVRVFEAGVENYGEGEKREATRSQARRLARMQRRQTERRARRRRKVFYLLQSASLLPAFAHGSYDRFGGADAARDALLKELDSALLPAALQGGPTARAQDIAQRLPYFLRASALDRPLSRHELGRALYHLAQRRGFESNRRAPAKAGDDDRSAVKSDISRLQAAMDELDASTGRPRARTLGEYLWGLDPETERIRRRWTARSMFKREFEAIWSAQQPYHGALLGERLRRDLFRALFHQRPLQSQTGLIGTCELEDGGEWLHPESGEVYRVRRCRRAPRCLLVSQRFRIWQDLNNLSWTDENYQTLRLTLDQKRKLFDALDTTRSFGKSDLKKLLGLKGKLRFSFEAAGQRELKGNLTNAQLLALFGDRWRDLDSESCESVVLELWSLSEAAAKRRAQLGRGPWAWIRPTESEIHKLEQIHLVEDYSPVSRRAMARLLPHLERGEFYSRCVELGYGRRPPRREEQLLPPVPVACPTLRNPVVSRALSETRRVVNALIKLYGKPELIRVELARDMKRNKKDRERMLKATIDRRDERERAFQRAREARGGGRLAQDDVLRILLWDECDGVCPYTGETISMGMLFNGEVDIEHIIPYSRSLDDSFANKTLCLAHFNRNVKRNQTPFEAMHARHDDWEAALQRLHRHVHDKRMSPSKLRRFLMAPEQLEEFLSDFTTRHLNDTRYASRVARGYLASLYGGDERGCDAEGRLRVQVSPGQVTAILRRALSMSRVLGGGEKSRADHRHHAVDAVTIAMTSPAIVKRLTDAANAAESTTGRAKPVIAPPWDTFELDVSRATDAIVVSHANYNRVRGRLFRDTLYGTPRSAAGQRLDDTADEKTYVHVRVAVQDLSRKDVESDDVIVDVAVRDRVREKLGAGEPEKTFDPERPETLPRMTNGPVIRKARVRRAKQTLSIGRGHRQRRVENAENHHVEVVASGSRAGREQWKARLVSLADARARADQHNPVVDRDGAFVFSLGKGDVLTVPVAEHAPKYLVIKSINASSGGRVAWVPHTDARGSKERKTERCGTEPTIGSLRGLVSGKVVVTPIGLVRRSRA